MDSGSRILITGGSGTIGKYLTSMLLSEGFSVSHLSRESNQSGKVKVFRWDPAKSMIDPECLNGVDHIIHLSGANIGEKRWSASRKKEIMESRVESAKLLYKVIKDNSLRIKTFISASGISWYGTVTTDRIFREDDPPADDFLGTVCREWEEAANIFSGNGIRTVRIRSALVLARNDIALRRMTASAKIGVLGYVGSGRQYMPWIHIHDICGIYVRAIMNVKMQGAYNAVSPQHVSHKQFMKTLSEILRKPLFPVPAPPVALKIVYGEMAKIVLEGSRVSADKIISEGYRFRFGNLVSALNDIYNSQTDN